MYNSQNVLERCVNSIINQTYQNLEIILVNDGSTDNSLDLCRKLKNQDSRITVINQKNQGVSSARNEGIRRVTGEYIAFVDSDDWLEKNMYEEMIHSISKFNSEVCISNYFNDTKRISLHSEKIHLNRKEIYEYLIKNMIGPLPIGSSNVNKKIMGNVWRFLFKKELIVENGVKFPTNIYLSEDLIFCLNVLFKAEQLVINPGFFYHYEDVQDSAIRKFKPEFRIQQQRAFNMIENICQKNNVYEDVSDNLNSMYVEMVVSEIINQVHPKNPQTIVKSIENIKLICEDKKFQDILININRNQLKVTRRIIFQLIKLKQYWVVYIIYKLIL